MYFYLYNIDYKNGSLLLSGREFIISGEFNLKKIHKSKSRIRQFIIPSSNIKIPYLLACGYNVKSDTEINLAIESVKEFCRKKQILIQSIDPINQKNIFYNDLKEDLILLKMTLHQKYNLTHVDSPYIVKTIPQFKCMKEFFIISKKIKGPCLIKINIESDYVLYNQYKEVTIPSLDCITVVDNIELPNLNYCSLSFNYNNGCISSYALCLNGNRIISGCLDTNSTLKNIKVGCNTFITYNNTKKMIEDIHSRFDTEEIDNIIFYNLPQNILSQLNLHRMLVCDFYTYTSGTLRSKDYSLNSLSEYFNYDKVIYKYGFEHGAIFSELSTEAKTIYELYIRSDALLLCKEMAEISGSTINTALWNRRSLMIDFTLLHEFYDRSFLLPSLDKHSSQVYTGGLVLTPQIGVYDTATLLLDFNSLYPSIIQEYNVCFSTIGHQNLNTDVKLNNEELLKAGEDSKTKPKGILPHIISNLVSRRKQVKKLIVQNKSGDNKIYDIRQKALKLLANSIYGCLGFPVSRFCNYTMASFITKKGRDLLLEAQGIAIELGYKVIYGDTDSIMVNTQLKYCPDNLQQIKTISEEIKTSINGKYKNIEIDLEKIFVKLFLYTKKKYAGVWVKDNNVFQNEYKGIDSIRRDFSQSAVDILDKILNVLLDHSNLDDFASTKKEIFSILHKESIELTKRPQSDFIINTILAKPLSLYAPNSPQPHVNLANRLLTQGVTFQQGDVISYIICDTGTNESFYKRAFLPSEALKVDYDYYISNKILPSLSRLLQITNYISNEEMQRIFGVKISQSLHSNIQTHKIKFNTKCCENTQSPSNRCEKCNSEIDEDFYFAVVKKLINKEIISLYSVEPTCPDCKIPGNKFTQKCDICDTKTVYRPENEEFDIFIDNLQSSFENTSFETVKKFIGLHIIHSGFKVVDLTIYFKEEIENYNKKH